MKRGKGPEAVRLQREACELCRRLEQRELEVICRVALASYLSGLDRRDLAIEELESAAAFTETHGIHRHGAQALLALGLVQTLDGQPPAAAHSYVRAARTAEEAGDALLAIAGFRLAAQLALGLRAEPQAMACLQEALRVAETSDVEVVQGSGAAEASRQLAGLARHHELQAQAALLEDQAAKMELGEYGLGAATRRIQLRYGGFHRVVAREEGGTTIHFEHDTEDRLTGVVNEAGERYGFELDDAGRVKAEVGFDGSRRTFSRDKAGRVTREVLPSGLQRELTYDPAGRITEVRCSDGSMTSFEYRADGALMRASNDETEVVYERDSLGRILSEECDGVRVASRYGPEGSRALLESTLGARQSIELDALGEVEVLRHGRPKGFEDPLEQRFERDALGLEKARVLPGGVRVSWRRDESGRPLQRRSTRVSEGVVTAELGALSYQWRGGDQISTLIDAARGPRFFDHDTRGRLIRERRPDEVIDRALDEVGNIYRRADRSDRRYYPGSRLVEVDVTAMSFR